MIMSRPTINNPITAGLLTVGLLEWLSDINPMGLNQELRCGLAYQVAGEIADVVLEAVDFSRFDDSKGTFDQQYACYRSDGEGLVGSSVTQAFEANLFDMGHESSVPYDVIKAAVIQFLKAKGIPLAQGV